MIIEKTALLPVSADEAFALITQPDRLRRWLAVSARVDQRAGGEFRWTLTPMAVAAGTVTEVDPGRRIVFGFGWEQSTEPRTDTLTIPIQFIRRDQLCTSLVRATLHSSNSYPLKASFRKLMTAFM